MICIIHISSRFITGYIANNNMQAINSITALEIAFKIRNIRYFYHLIHQLDKGSRYYSKADITTLKRADIPITMANDSLEKSYATKLNSIIKNEDLQYEVGSDFRESTSSLATVIYQSNSERPHSE